LGLHFGCLFYLKEGSKDVRQMSLLPRMKVFSITEADLISSGKLNQVFFFFKVVDLYI
jgi:hypothetical protein